MKHYRFSGSHQS